MLSSTTPWAAPSRKEEGGVCEDRHTHPQHAQDMDAGSRTSGEQVSPENFRFPRVVSWAAHARSYPSPMIRAMRGGLIFLMIRATYGRGGDNKLVSRSSRDSSEPDDSRHVWARRANVLQRDSLNRVSGYSL